MANRNVDNLPPSVKYIDLLPDETNAQLAVAGVTTVYGKSFIPPKNCSFGLVYKFASPGVVLVKVELESGIDKPGTENSADTAWAVGEIVNAAVADTVAHAEVASPVVAPYCRLKLTGSGANDAGTYLASCKFTYEKNM